MKQRVQIGILKPNQRWKVTHNPVEWEYGWRFEAEGYPFGASQDFDQECGLMAVLNSLLKEGWELTCVDTSVHEQKSYFLQRPFVSP